MFFSVEVFDADKLGKDKSLGKVEINPRDFDGEEAKWFPLKGVKSGEILLNADILAPGQSPYALGADGQQKPVGGTFLDIKKFFRLHDIFLTIHLYFIYY